MEKVIDKHASCLHGPSTHPSTLCPFMGCSALRRLPGGGGGGALVNERGLEEGETEPLCWPVS